MAVVPFDRTPWKQGDSVVITVPPEYVKNGVLKLGEEHRFYLDVPDVKTEEAQEAQHE